MSDKTIAFVPPMYDPRSEKVLVHWLLKQYIAQAVEHESMTQPEILENQQLFVLRDADLLFDNNGTMDICSISMAGKVLLEICNTVLDTPIAPEQGLVNLLGFFAYGLAQRRHNSNEFVTLFKGTWQELDERPIVIKQLAAFIKLWTTGIGFNPGHGEDDRLASAKNFYRNFARMAAHFYKSRHGRLGAWKAYEFDTNVINWIGHVSVGQLEIDHDAMAAEQGIYFIEDDDDDIEIVEDFQQAQPMPDYTQNAPSPTPEQVVAMYEQYTKSELLNHEKMLVENLPPYYHMFKRAHSVIQWKRRVLLGIYHYESRPERFDNAEIDWKLPPCEYFDLNRDALYEEVESNTAIPIKIRRTCKQILDRYYNDRELAKKEEIPIDEDVEETRSVVDKLVAPETDSEDESDTVMTSETEEEPAMQVVTPQEPSKPEGQKETAVPVTTVTKEESTQPMETSLEVANEPEVATPSPKKAKKAKKAVDRNTPLRRSTRIRRSKQ
eukprot:gb/GEZJ01006406.1/.p1 GENE.gb/GEZJ01006406.1/~~gb/GEZJ01006406.1/.p1  ORF type:complete len:495 (-),score=99.00 gb/GEZJ01006406.1/:28-1512(-)